MQFVCSLMCFFTYMKQLILISHTHTHTPRLSKTYKYQEPDLYTICLHVSIAFLYCLSLSAPPLSTMKLLPSSFSKLAFPSVRAEIHPVHAGVFLLTYSRKLTEDLGICLKLRALFPELGEAMGDVSSSSCCVWEILTPVKGPVRLCTEQQQDQQRFIWLTMWASTQFSLDCAAVTWCSSIAALQVVEILWQGQGVQIRELPSVCQVQGKLSFGIGAIRTE